MSATHTTLSLALITKNEERCLARCLKSIRSAVDEIVLVDTGSTDDTVAVARQFEAKVSHFTWVNDFSAARNAALERTTGDWILVLDADEYASEPLAAEIRQFVQTCPAVGQLRIVSEFRRNQQTLCSQTFVSRLFPRGAHFQGRIHEQLVCTLPRFKLKGELWHDGYLEMSKSDRNVKLLLQAIRSSRRDPYLLFQLAIEYNSLQRPEDARQCLEEALAASRLEEPFAPNLIVDYLYTLMELKRYETALELIEKNGCVVQDFPDFHLACGLFYMNLVRSNPAKHVGYLPKIEESFRRCLALGESDKYKSVKGSGSFLAYFNLGTLYHVFGNEAGARDCFEKAAGLGYAPAVQMLPPQKG